MAKFIMMATIEDGKLHIETENQGFTGLEIIGLFESKKEDILRQMKHPAEFKRIVDDGIMVTEEESK